MVGKTTPEPRTLTVLFVDQTVGGELAKWLQKAEDRLARVTGYRVRITETSGSQLRRVLRPECYTCNQGGEKLENCKTRNILNESSCVLCNPEETAKSRKGKKLSDCQGVYVGETGRSWSHWWTGGRNKDMAYGKNGWLRKGK